jgi:hypothetical protein
MRDMSDKWYVGIMDGLAYEVFEWDEPILPTADTAGYDGITGPFPTKEDAEGFLNDNQTPS